MKINLTGVQACVKSTVFVSEYDKFNNLRTGGFICGYRGSPLASFDKEVEKNLNELNSNNIEFVYGLNEDLALTAVAGTQHVSFFGKLKNNVQDGIVGYWYGKGPGLDRSFDVLKHYNFQGTSKHGGVVLFCGDDLECKSSTLPYHSVNTLKSFYVPVLYPSTVEEIFELVLKAVYLSRFSGSFVGIKIITDIADAYQSVNLENIKSIKVNELERDEKINVDLFKTGVDQERQIFYQRIPLMKKFIENNNINKKYKSNNGSNVGLICVGYNFSKFVEIMGENNDFGFDVLHLRCSWPLVESEIINFSREKSDLLIIEEKDPIVEEQIKNIFYDNNIKINVKGQNILKRNLQPTVEEIYELLREHDLIKTTRTSLPKINTTIDFSRFKKFPKFCGGCPHNISTKLPENSYALLGIGCHYLAKFSNNRTITVNPMGYEGGIWNSIHKFLNSEKKHVFVNLGDGTYFHSGILSIRFAVANKTPVTFKILFNGVVGMTGGQNIDGDLTLEKIVDQLLAEGVKSENIAIVSHYYHEKNWKYFLKKNISVHQKSENLNVQKKFKNVNDVTVIIYDQLCSTEKKRRIKRGVLEKENTVVLINKDICDGCGDCQEKSSCLSIETFTEKEFLYEKRKINLDNCGLDKTCIEGFCPSFIEISDKDFFKNKFDLLDTMLEKFYYKKRIEPVNENYKILIKGIGGNGTSTLNKILSDSFLENGYNKIRSLDQTGLAQRNGEVSGTIKVFKNNISPSIDEFNCFDLSIFFDFELFLTSLKNLRSKNVVVNTHVYNKGQKLIPELGEIKKYLNRETNYYFLNFSEVMDYYNVSQKNLNLVVLGFCFEKNLIPAKEKILLNHIIKNLGKNQIKYFQFGRFIELFNMEINKINVNVDEKIEKILLNYDKKSLEKFHRFKNLLDEKLTDNDIKNKLKLTVFDLLYKKDEYEVARLWLEFFSENSIKKGKIYLSPPLYRKLKKKIGLNVGLAKLIFTFLSRIKFLRNTIFDFFKYSREEKLDLKFREIFLEKIFKLINKEKISEKELEKICETVRSVRGYGYVRKNNILKIHLEDY